MGRVSNLAIKESLDYLQCLLKAKTEKKDILRLQSLLHIKQGTFGTREELACHLGFHIRTMERWLKKYEQQGISSLFSVHKNQGKPCNIPEDIQHGLRERLYDANGGFRSYVEALAWVEQTYSPLNIIHLEII